MLLSYMSQSSRGSFFDQQLDSYRNRLSAIKQEEALNWAKKIAESEQPIEALKQAVAEIATPLALDFLREGIMHYAGVASARIGNKLKGLDPKFQEIFKGRMDELVKLKNMTPEQRKKWIADEVKSRRDARLAAAKEKADALRQEAGMPPIELQTKQGKQQEVVLKEKKMVQGVVENKHNLQTLDKMVLLMKQMKEVL